MRPTLHFTPKKGWINDPNGLVFDGKQYHLFAQHNPDDIKWGPMHWLHAVSDDMLHWKELGIALYPDEIGAMFSGSGAMMADGRMALMYTAHGEQETQCVAFSEDGMQFEKYAGNPVIPNPGLRDFRDPKLFWNKKYSCWSIALAATDHVDFYKSENLIDWQKTGEFGKTENRLGDIYECPDVVFLKNEAGEELAMLTASMICFGQEDGCKMQYFLGEFDGDTFIETHPAKEALRVDVGYDSYAGVTYNGTKENIGINWMSMGSCPLPMKDHCGCLSLPRKLGWARTREGARVTTLPVLPECAFRASKDAALPEGACAIRVRADEAFVLTLKDANGEAAFTVSMKDGCLSTCRAQSEAFAPESAYNRDERRMTSVQRLVDGSVDLTVVLDGYCVEVFADGGLYAHGLLAFPEGGFKAFACQGADVEIAELK